ncbi:MAG: flagellar hook-length control protein FliK, partial [Nitrospirae bacterium]
EQTEKESTTGEEGIKSHPLAEDGGPDVHETQETGRGENFSHTLKTEAESQTDDSETIRMPGRIKVSPEKIEVRVDTDKLGRIDLSVGHRAGELTAQIGVDRLQSLIEIQKNLPQLFTSLSEEGWSNGNFTFFLKDESRQGKDNKGIGKTVITETGQASLTQGRGAYHHQGALSIRV